MGHPHSTGGTVGAGSAWDPGATAICLTATRGRGRFPFRAVQHVGQLPLGFLPRHVFLCPQHTVAPSVQAVMAAPVASREAPGANRGAVSAWLANSLLCAMLLAARLPPERLVVTLLSLSRHSPCPVLPARSPRWERL